MEFLEQSLGNEALSVYLQGTCGDIAPSEGGQLCVGGDAEVRRLGSQLAKDVTRVLESRMERLGETSTESQTVRLKLPLQTPPSREELELLAKKSGVFGEWSRFLLQSRVLPIGYSNGMIGYIPTAKQLFEGGYESIDSTYYFFMPAPYKPSIEGRIKKVLTAMAKPRPF